ncbi:MAG: putative membrane protein [Cenarchaeum symbiont of Oopsacas minuta]|nr:putative membrane protein [Cenarchaeum symbiont of Oopsacas minuta]
MLLDSHTKVPDENVWYSSLVKNKHASYLSQKLSMLIHSDIRTAGIAMDSHIETAKNLGRMMLIFALGVPIAILLWIYFEQPILLLTIIIIPIVLIWPKIKLMVLISERKIKIGDEVAFFSIYAWVLQTIGGSLIDIISGIRGSKLLPHIEKEADLLSRDVGFFPENPLDVVNKRALEHPNQMLRNLFVGYVSIYKDGGDLVNYLEKTTEDLFSQLKSRFHRYEEQAKSLAILTNAIFSMMPIFLVAGMFIMTIDVLSSLTTLMFIMLPVAGVIIYMMADSVQPKFADNVKFNLLSVPIGAVGVIFGYFVLGQLWATMVLGVLFLALTNTLLTFTAVVEIKATNTALGDFLRDITESRKIGNPISVAIHRLAKNRKYNHIFDQKISSIASQLHFGTPLSKCIQHGNDKTLETVKMRSWLGRMTFFMLGKMEKVGNVSAQSLEILTGYMIKIKNERQGLVAALQIFWILAYVNPFIMVYISKMLKGWFENNSMVEGVGTNYLPFEVLSASPEFLNLINITIALSSVILGILMNKIVNFGMTHTSNLAIISAITFVAIWAEPYYPTSL